MKFSVVAKTDVGRKRKNNEDSFWVDTRVGFFAVADGMGGHASGEVASQEALATAFDTLMAGKKELEAFYAAPGEAGAGRVERLLERAVQSAAYFVYGITEIEPERKGMGTTLSILLMTPAAAFIAHVGDSRIYVARGGQIRLLTRDHTLVAEMVARGRINTQEARTSKFSNILLRAVGNQEFVEVDIASLSFQPGDVFLLCSDGLAGYLEDERDILERLAADDLEGSAVKLIDFALEKGGRDNVTVVLVRVEP